MKNNSLPNSIHYQYISHLYHSGKLTPLVEYTADPDWNYPDYDHKRFTKILIDNADFIRGKKVLDLGCHSGFMLYIAHHLGATKITGVNGRENPLRAGKFFFDQMNIEANLIQNQIENFQLIEKLCNEHDTVIVASVFEHLRNPEHLLDIISNSNIKNIIIEGSVVNDDNREPKLYYRIEDASFEFKGFNKNLPRVLASMANLRFFEVVLYYNNWKITKIEPLGEFNKNWFGTQGLLNTPFYRNSVVITAEKFDVVS